MSAISLVDENGENAGSLQGEGGVARIRALTGRGTQSRNRYRTLDNAGTRLKVEWPSGADIKDLSFFAMPIPGSVITGDEFVLVAIDSVNDAAANASLTQTDSEIADVQWWPVPLGVPINIPQSAALVNGTLGGGRVDAKTVGGVAINLFIGAN